MFQEVFVGDVLVVRAVRVHVCTWFHEWPEVELPSLITPTIFRESESLTDPTLAESASLCRWLAPEIPFALLLGFG